MAQHSNYWTCSAFADWLRGTPKPGSATSKGWHDWTVAAKAKHPIRYWVADDGLGHLQDFVTWPIRKIYDVKYYINNRYVTRTHALSAHPRDIKPGTWSDVGNRFLPCLFNELVDFIEIESAWSHIAWGSKEAREKYDAPFYATGWFRWRTWRCPQAGLDHLDWAMTLTNTDWCEPSHKDYGKPTQQATRAKELKELYLWWTDTYRNRPDPYEASGWSAICESRRESHKDDGFMFEDRTPAEKKETRRALDVMRKIEAQYEKENEAMMIRLIKIRDALWT